MSSPRAATLVLSFQIGRVSKVSKSHFALCKAVIRILYVSVLLLVSKDSSAVTSRNFSHFLQIVQT